jgi:predicted RNA-binding protein associated with RNAse of E/G family
MIPNTNEPPPRNDRADRSASSPVRTQKPPLRRAFFRRAAGHHDLVTFNFAAPPAVTRASLDAVPHIHPPKVELFDVAAMSNTDPKGFRRTVDEYRQEDFGLYMARAVLGHSELAYVESWLLPEFGLRVSRWQRWPGTPEREDVYIDLVDIDPDFGRRTHSAGPVWRVVDVYLDIHLYSGDRLEVVDTDELLAALDAGLIKAGTAQRALERLYRTVDGITRNGYEVERWLAEQGVQLTWQGR